MVCSIHCRHRNRFFNIVELHVQTVFRDVDAWDLFSTQTNTCHGGHGFCRILARSGFRREHYRIGTVQHGVGHVHHFCTGWHRVGDHRFHHLSGGDHRAVQLTCATNQGFLNTHQLRVADFHTQVATRNHHHVRGKDHVVHSILIANGFRTLNFGDDFGIAACITRQTTRIVQIFAAAREGDSQVVNTDQCSSHNIRFIFISKRFRREAAAQLVDAFIVGEWAADGDFGEHFHALNF